MKLGGFMMPLHPPGHNFTETIAADLEQIVEADRLGFSEYWIGEHFTAEWENIPAPDLLIAQALGRTKNIILGTGVTCLPNHHPFGLAHRIAQLDHMARGRFYWGVGSGGFPGDLEAFGFDLTSGENRKMTGQTIQAVLDIWNGQAPGTYESKYWSYTIPKQVDSVGLRLHLRPYQQPHPPIGVAGVSQSSGTLRLAGERGWIPMSINIIPPVTLKTHWDAVEEGAQTTGRQPSRADWRIARTIYVAETTEQARKEAIEGSMGRDFRDYFFRLLPLAGMFDLFKTSPDIPDEDVTLEYLCDEVWIVGSPDEVERRLRALYDEVGGFGVLLAMAHEWEPLDGWKRSLNLLSQEVLPRLKDLTPAA